MIIIAWLLGSLVVGFFGQGRRIGLGGAFFVSLILSPLIGAIFVATSKTDEEYEMEVAMHKLQKKQAEAATEQNTVSVADQLEKLAKLKNDGVITQDEFDEQKKRLLQ